jgi:glycerol-3-phosphate dehydrogenase
MHDIAIIGGGIHGCGIARDAAGRGLSVLLAEKADLASGTSSASTKLIHGGLRYLEHFSFHLVRESLREREVLPPWPRTSSGRCGSCCRIIAACAPPS